MGEGPCSPATHALVVVAVELQSVYADVGDLAAGQGHLPGAASVLAAQVARCSIPGRRLQQEEALGACRAAL